jgi:putative tryptophan/tyrosine transport system substrate-binding protein
MRRREFITGLSSATAAWPLTTRAQQPDRIRRIGILMAYAEDDPEGILRVAKFRQELERLGWSEGRNIRIDYRFTAASADQFQVLAKELVALHPDVILCTCDWERRRVAAGDSRDPDRVRQRLRPDRSRLHY